MKKFICALGVLAFLSTGLFGCTSISKKGQVGKPLESQLALRFSDMPVPANFKMLAEDSYSFESSGVRVGLLRYQGKASTDQVVNFYKEQMPMYSWFLLNITEYGDCIMNFEREAESCIITIVPKGKSVVVSLSFGPKAAILLKKARQPVK